MKKTLIALAVAASAAVSVSGSAMAWTQSGTGGNVNIGGTLTPAEVTPWEVWIGTGVQDLNSLVAKGDTSVTIDVQKAVPVLGIRTVAKESFNGKVGISPQISYGSGVALDGFNAGVTTLTLDINDKTNQTKIGSVSVPFSAAAVASWDNPLNGNKGYRALYAANSGDGFFGGLGKSADKVAISHAALNLINDLNPDFSSNFNDLGLTIATSYAQTENFQSAAVKHSAYYGSGIQAGAKATITLDNAVGDDAIEWEASLPVTVSYQ
ncbi:MULTISPECIES: hypothetical protein [Escherichia]|uniref:F4 family fimbrial subunit n=1 Tax=Escherichia TaxID=561 RepID=UPI0015E4C914|nr:MULTISPECIES: hypothetical protein [Escherichia]EDQ6049273.1 hypothetical protein [Salmonella enterica subsp. enterica]EEE4529000.1 hypothetical protein [Salmonella enterica subsp. enterica serovar Enteritidis]EDR6620766.1 hypothetical protein [Salmonella enterica subsp. enterica]EDS9425488.1 hypothetical protein [Salmonella enterica subsp. enterica]QLP33747.1 hypothetical protein HVY12_23025 [Escherichia marmotae]